jgi:hypothetical protein
MTITTATLKNAAFAIECDLWTDPATGANYLAKDGAILSRWEPEHDDGDSFRLMSQLQMMVEIDHYHVLANGCSVSVYESGGEYSATRAAVLLAASEIGEKIKCQ